MRRLDVDTWEELASFLSERAPEGTDFYFRGQRDPSWPLASSLERRILALRGVDGAEIDAAVAAHLDRFKRATSGRRGPAPKDLTEEQWWALGRHHGLITPLLDWTEKPYIALFFALKGLGRLAGDPEHEHSAADGPFALYRLCDDGKLASSADPHRLTIVSTPIDELGRLQQQRGLFTWIRSDRYFDLQSLLDDTGRGDLLTQVVVAAAVIPDALRDLQLHGIDHHMLLPDMYGAATHANALLEFPACETGRARRARPLLQRSHP